MPAPTVKPRYVPPEAASCYCSISRTTLYKLIKSGEIRSSTIGARRVIDLDSVDAFLERRRDDLGGPDPSPETPACPASTTSSSMSGSGSTSS